MSAATLTATAAAAYDLGRADALHDAARAIRAITGVTGIGIDREATAAWLEHRAEGKR